jgi:hypothetical protein
VGEQAGQEGEQLPLRLFAEEFLAEGALHGVSPMEGIGDEE